jgi:hypothetical protein
MGWLAWWWATAGARAPVTWPRSVVMTIFKMLNKDVTLLYS